MADTNQPSSVAQATGGYGYTSDEVKVNPFNFGLNAGNCFLTKFEWINNGGKEGAEQEALDIIFTINGVEKSYRQFPITKAFLKDNKGETTDPNSAEFKEAISDLNAIITHILHVYVDSDSIKAAMSRPIANFKEFCQIAMSILPKNYKEISLDIFLQWGWNLGDKEKTYLEIPSKMKYGRWLALAQPGNWKENKVENPADTVREALYYTNEKDEKHVFVKNGWFMNSNFAHQQRLEGATGDSAASTTATSNAPPPPPQGKAAAW